MTARAYIALGANLGDPVATVRAAIDALRRLPRSNLVATSSLYRTAPVGLKQQPDFINAVALLDTDLQPRELLDSLFKVEHDFGRERSIKNAPRTLDLDLLLWDDIVMAEDGLTLPHPRMTERAFVLAPLAEITPDLAIPGHDTVTALLARLGDQRIEKLA